MAVNDIEISQQKLCILEMDDNDIIGTDLGFTTTSTSYSKFTRALIVTFNPPSQGDYLIMAGTTITTGLTSETTHVKLLGGGVDYGDCPIDLVASTDKLPWFTMVKVNLTTGNKTWVVHCHSGGGAAVFLSNTWFLAFRVDDMQNLAYAESRSASTTTGGLHTDKVVLTATPDEGEQIMFWSSLIANLVSGSGRVQGRVTFDGNNESALDIDPISHTSKTPCFVIQKKNTDGNSTIWKTTFARLSFGTAEIKESSIAVMDLTGNTTVKILGGKILGGAIK